MNSSMEPKQPLSEYQANLEVLMQLPLFAGLPLEPLKVLAYLCKRETFRPEEIIFHEHEIDTNAYYIFEGMAELVSESNGEAVFTTFGERDFIGSMSLFCDIKRLFTLKARTKVICLTPVTRQVSKGRGALPGNHQQNGPIDPDGCSCVGGKVPEGARADLRRLPEMDRRQPGVRRFMAERIMNGVSRR
jgi:CRP/FNR family cyclic AMP-dependent transcriptional regulator